MNQLTNQWRSWLNGRHCNSQAVCHDHSLRANSNALDPKTISCSFKREGRKPLEIRSKHLWLTSRWKQAINVLYQELVKRSRWLPHTAQVNEYLIIRLCKCQHQPLQTKPSRASEGNNQAIKYNFSTNQKPWSLLYINIFSRWCTSDYPFTTGAVNILSSCTLLSMTIKTHYLPSLFN